MRLASWLATADMGEKTLTDSLEARLDAIESRFACMDLVHTYARLIRSDQPEGISALFAEDGVFEGRNGEPDRPEYTVMFHDEGRAGIHAHMMPMKGNLHPLPLIHNLSIEVDGDTAKGNCVMEAQIYKGEHKVIGEYHDSFRRIDGKWYFAARIYTVFRGGSTI